MFHNAITSVLSTLLDFGALGVAAVLVAIGLYVLTKWRQRWLFIRQLRMDRITVPELRQLIDNGQALVILDVRPREIRMQDGIIPGAIAAHPTELDPFIKNYSRDVEIVVYCACPNAESAATAAKHLKQAGFKKIWPLHGGMEARVDAGYRRTRPACESGSLGRLPSDAALTSGSKSHAPKASIERQATIIAMRNDQLFAIRLQIENKRTLAVCRRAALRRSLAAKTVPAVQEESDYQRSVRVRSCIRPVIAWRATSVAMQPLWPLALM